MSEQPCALRRTAVLQAFEALLPGQSLEIVNDRDPSRLRLLISKRTPQPFGWTYLESGPWIWRVKVNLPE